MISHGLSKTLCEHRKKLAYPFVYLDIGARGASLGIWQSLGENLHYVGFEPDENECTRMNASYQKSSQNPIQKYWPIALAGENGRVQFVVTRDPNCSSLLVPNMHTARLIGLEQLFAESNRFELDAMTLDSWAEFHAENLPSFIKLDIQGAELAVLKHAGRALNDCAGLQVEVEFLEVYEGQPRFSDVDQEIRKLGFILVDLRKKYARCGSTLMSTRGLLAWGDAVYVRDPASWLRGESQQDQNAVLRKASSLLITCEAYGIPDYAFTRITDFLSDAEVSDEIKIELKKLIEEWQGELLKRKISDDSNPGFFRKIANRLKSKKEIINDNNNTHTFTYPADSPRTYSERFLFPSEYN
jgi:FkbM family methyltransferase